MNESLSLKKAQEIIDLKSLSAADMDRVRQISQEVKLEDSESVVLFGVGVQKDISSFADSILETVRTKDTGEVGDLLSELMIKVKELNVGSLSQGNFWAKIPIVGPLLNKAKRFIARYYKMSTHIEKIVDELDKARLQLIKDITLMDNLFEKNQEYLKNLDLYVAAGQYRLTELYQDIVPELKRKAETSKDPMDVQKYQDALQFVNRFDKKLHDLILSRTVAIHTSPQIRLIQNGNQVLVDKIQSSILNTIPLWKNQIVIAISLLRQKKALKLQREVSEYTNELLRKNAELLKDSTIGIARESERGIVEVETLERVNQDLITTIEETLRIQEDGRNKRRQVENELVTIEKGLKEKLIRLK